MAIREIQPQTMKLRPDFVSFSGWAASTVYDRAAAGEIRLIKVGRATYVDLNSFEKFLANNQFTPKLR